MLLAALFYIGFNLTLANTIAALPFPAPGRQTVVALGGFAAGTLLYQLGARGVPPEIAMGLSIGFATLGLLTQQTKQITEAQQVRGYDVRPKNIIARVKVIVALILPIFFATIQRSQDIAVAIQARAFDFNVKARTYRRVLLFQRMDYIFIALMLGLLLSGLILNYLGLSKPTELLIKAVFDL